MIQLKIYVAIFTLMLMAFLKWELRQKIRSWNCMNWIWWITFFF